MSENKHNLYPIGADLPVFHARAPWWGGDLQTLRNRIIHDPRPLNSSSEHMSFPVSDGSGDTLTGLLETPQTPPTGPLIILIHGLTGCADSTYVRETAKLHLERGRRVLRLNLRGAGSSSMTCRGYYHAGCAVDLYDVLINVPATCVSEGIFFIGFSLGGNILINLLARYCGSHPIVGAATVSAPIEPWQAAKRLMARRNALYHHWLLRSMKEECLRPQAQLSMQETKAIKNARTIYQFDNDFIAPRNGFTDADDYYFKTAGAKVARDISISTLMIHAEDDPWIPSSPYHQLNKDCPPNIEVVLTRSGGHVGFHAKGAKHTWHDRLIDRFIGTITSQTS